MFKLLVKIFVKNADNTSDPVIRKKYASFTSIYGIFWNIVLFIFKAIAGTISGSMAIITDAVNNLTDAGSSLITLVGFQLAGRKPDSKHPFGYGRIEYIAGFIVSILIIVLGVEFGIESIEKIIEPERVSVGLVPAIIMVAAIFVKLYMFTYNSAAGKKINSEALLAAAKDSLTDCIATAAALISMGMAYFFDINVDGWAGLLVAVFIFYAGITSAKDTLAPLLGKPPEAEYVKEIEEIVKAYPDVMGIHDLIVHDYGPGSTMITMHAEVNGSRDIFVLHDEIDSAEMALNEKFDCLATIHMDPIVTDDPEIHKLRKKVEEKIREIYLEAKVHDFRMVPGITHTNIIFDVVLPMSCKDTDMDAREKICGMVKKTWEHYNAVVTIDRSYV